MFKIGIIGGGTAGATTALELGKLGLDITLFEKNNSLISGPPFCHLHAGGNLYREISTNQCITLLKQSIEFLKKFPYAIDNRPTVIAVPKRDDQEAIDLIPRLKTIQNEYKKLILDNSSNKVLGEVQEYFKLYNKDDIEKLKKRDDVKRPKSSDEWMIVVAKNLDFNKLKFPIVMVQEYGLNLFSLSAGISLALDEISNCKILLNSEVMDIKQNRLWNLSYKDQNDQVLNEEFDYIINASGFSTGKIDDMIGFKKNRFVEFKAAYITKWEENNKLWPEIIFHGKRGSKDGMGQFTPYKNNYFQLHGMTEDITLFKNGLAKSTTTSANPKLDQRFLNKIKTSWNNIDYDKRTKKAIEHISYFIPNFSKALVGAKPLFGAQQIPGNDKDLRAADLSFEDNNYLRCEIVKVSSVFTMIELIIEKFTKLGYLDKKNLQTNKITKVNNKILTKKAEEISLDRNYPKSLATIVNPL
ncbi:MAG: NAD(P)-binding protein [Campylobacterota bacterium]|nr:NAD(P)-binding protein [Campylobacterota bacterium]